MSPSEMQLSHIISLAGEVLFVFYGSFCNVMSFIHFEKKMYIQGSYDEIKIESESMAES